MRTLINIVFQLSAFLYSFAFAEPNHTIENGVLNVTSSLHLEEVYKTLTTDMEIVFFGHSAVVK